MDLLYPILLIALNKTRVKVKRRNKRKNVPSYGDLNDPTPQLLHASIIR